MFFVKCTWLYKSVCATNLPLKIYQAIVLLQSHPVDHLILMALLGSISLKYLMFYKQTLQINIKCRETTYRQTNMFSHLLVQTHEVSKAAFIFLTCITVCPDRMDSWGWIETALRWQVCGTIPQMLSLRKKNTEWRLEKPFIQRIYLPETGMKEHRQHI